MTSLRDSSATRFWEVQTSPSAHRFINFSARHHQFKNSNRCCTTRLRRRKPYQDNLELHIVCCIQGNYFASSCVPNHDPKPGCKRKLPLTVLSYLSCLCSGAPLSRLGCRFRAGSAVFGDGRLPSEKSCSFPQLLFLKTVFMIESASPRQQNQF